MIQSIEYHNFRLLRAAKLPLGPCTILVGANSSGKSTALLGLKAARKPAEYNWDTLHSLSDLNSTVQIRLNWGQSNAGVAAVSSWKPDGGKSSGFEKPDDVPQISASALTEWIRRMRVFGFSSTAIAQSSLLREDMEVREDGSGLAGTLDRLRDSEPERWEQLNAEFRQWFPEFDQLLFDVNGDMKSLRLRLRRNSGRLPIEHASDGTRMALALLTLAYLPQPPSLVAVEEPDHGMHPRLLERVQQALYRLAYPADFGETRAAVQVLATTHSPLLLDLFRDHPEEVVIAQREQDSATFARLVDRPDHEELLSGAPLGDIWYSGVLGGVPVGS
jgi:predicted ATPase